MDTVSLEDPQKALKYIKGRLLEALQKAVGQGYTIESIKSQYPDDKSARAFMEQARWPNGVVCPNCGNHDQKRIYDLTANPQAEIRDGLKKCENCRKTFTVTVGTVIEGHHQPLSRWLAAILLVCLQGANPASLEKELQINSPSQASELFNKLKSAIGEKAGKYQGQVPQQDFQLILRDILR